MAISPLKPFYSQFGAKILYKAVEKVLEIEKSRVWGKRNNAMLCMSDWHQWFNESLGVEWSIPFKYQLWYKILSNIYG